MADFDESRSARKDGGLDLLALVEDHDVSARLRNSIVAAAQAGTLPFHTVDAYAAAGDRAVPMMMRCVQNFGRKTAHELDVLIRTTAVHDMRASTPAERTEPLVARVDLLALFGDETIAEILENELFSARLTHVLARPVLASKRFCDFIDPLHASVSLMLSVPNCGRKSIAEFREFCERYITARLYQAGYADPAPLVAWLLGGGVPIGWHSPPISLDGTSPGTTPASTSLDPLAAPHHDRLAERLEWLIAELDPRVQMILRRRNGIGQARFETLEEIGVDLAVTRERIRQIEAKAIRRIRLRCRRAPIRDLLAAAVRAAWPALADGDEFLRHHDVFERRKILDPYVRLALHIEDQRLDTVLDEVAQALLFGWLAPDGDADKVAAVSEKLAAAVDAPLPQSLAMLVDVDEIPVAKIAAILIQGQPVRHDYLMPPRIGARLTRLIRLHMLLAGHEPILLEQLVGYYRAIYEDDPCGTRDAEIVMDAAPHLFLEIEDGAWVAIGRPNAATSDVGSSASPVIRAEEPGTIAHALQLTLETRGPTRLIDLMNGAFEILPEGRSANSIAPVLLTRRDLFVRALPGVYALPEHIPVYAHARPENWPVLFNDMQVRLYSVARYAGEPRRIFPLWSAAVEYALCRWARHSGGEGLYESLLAVAQIDQWPIDEVARQDWYRLQHQEGRYSLGTDLRHDAAYELPEFDRVFAACRYAATTGQFNWVAGNRLTGRKIDSHAGAGLVALLLRLGAISEITTDGFRWQRRHQATPLAAELCGRFDVAFSRLGAAADWTSALGRELAGQARLTSGSDWVDNAALRAMCVGTPGTGSVEIDDDDPLAEVLAAQRRARETARREATLDWLLEE